MRHVVKGAALLMMASITMPALAETITCESRDGRERFCPANTRGGVYLSAQLSREGCYQGDTWGHDRNGIWVSGGCRAQFQTGYGGNNWHQSNDYYSDRNRHSSNDGAKTAVAIGAILGAVAIAAAASNKGKSGPSSSSGYSYQASYDKGCTAGRSDRRAGRSMEYWRHSGSYDGRSEQAYSSGYNQCFRN
jgi:hypothetical protein